MAKRRSRDLAVGVMFALALTILSIVIMTVGTESHLFADKVSYTVVFPTAEGLVVGSPVKMSGVQVGTVSGIRLSRDASESGIEVTIGVNRDYAGRIREDSRAELSILQLLSGEKYVNLTPGSAGAAELPHGSIIEPNQDPEIMEQAAVAAENLNDITVSLKNILSKLENGEGMIAKMINDPEFGKQGLESLAGAATNLEALTAELRRGRGFAGRLLRDPVFAGRIDELGEAIGRFSSLMAKLDSGDGALGALLEDGGSAEGAIEDLGEAAASLRRTASRLESTDGLVGKLLNDREYSEALAKDLRTVLADLAEITGKINRGEGTLGALVNDSTVHDGLNEIVAGVNDSKFARWLLRHYRKKGIKSNQDDASEPVAP